MTSQTVVNPNDSQPKEIRDTDLANALRFAKMHVNDVLYCYPWKRWLAWDGRRWKVDDSGILPRKAKATVRAIRFEAAEEEDSKEREKLWRHARRSASSTRITAMLKEAQSEPSIPVLPGELDQNQWQLVVENGTVNLETGGLSQHGRSDRNTKLAPIFYDAEAECPRWLQFLDEIMAGDKDMIAFLQRAIGYSLTGDTSKRILFILYGSGANGKSTFLTTIRAMLGDYALPMSIETLLSGKRSKGAASSDIASLQGTRFVSTSEGDSGRRLAEGLIKDLTGGEDEIRARFLYAESFTFQPECKIWLATNHKPEVKGTDDAIWDRLRLIPFEVRIPEGQRDEGLADKLKEELSGILNWAIEGCLSCNQDGLGITEKIKSATLAYRNEMDILGQWLQDCCVLGPDKETASASLYASYQTWGGRENSTRFGRALAERGLTKRKSGRVKWQGVGLLSSYDEPF